MNYLKKCWFSQDDMDIVYDDNRDNSYAFAHMFDNCPSLENAIDIHTKRISPHMCDGMYEYTTSLASAPTLPATTLESYAYHNMFYGSGVNRTGISTCPILPPAECGVCCYAYMFACTNLTSIRDIQKPLMVNDNAYTGMFGDL